MKREKNTTSTNRGGISDTKRDIISRIKLLYTIFILIGIVIAARLVWVQVVSPSVRHNAKVLNNGILRKTSIPAHRGSILTREGEPLALSSFRYHAAVDFASEALQESDKETLDRNIDSLSRMLAWHFSPSDAERYGYEHITAKEYSDMFHKLTNAGKERSRHIFPRAVTLDEWNMMRRNFPILNDNMGIVCGADRTDERLYPSGDLAHQLIGNLPDSTKADTTRYGSGIERSYNNSLQGIDGIAIEQRVAHGFWTRTDDKRNTMPQDGCNVITTIDGGLQKIATERLRDALESEEASFGVAMVMEVATGNILCMVNLSSGRERGTNYNEEVFNHAFGTAMCPGSTFKLASAMALLEIGGCDVNTIVNIPASTVKVGDKVVVDSHRICDDNNKPMDSVTMKDGFAHSSNIYFAQAVHDRFIKEPERYTQFLEGLLFNGCVGLQEYGEKPAKLPHPGTPEWKRNGSNALVLPQLAYGYILELPPIHTLTFFNGVANGGCMVAPRLVDRIERDGDVVERMPVVTLREKMCSSKTIEGLKECLLAASADNRTAYKFRGLPFEFGCKTGTAQVWGSFISEAIKDKESMSNGMRPKEDNYYLGSVVTMFPIQQPKYTVMVCVAKQQTSTHPTYFGISLSGGTARTIMEYIYANDPTLHATIESPDTPYEARSIKGGSSDMVQLSAKHNAASASYDEAKGEWSKASVDEMGAATLTTIAIEDGLVPNVVGMGLSDALYVLESAGLRVTHSGNGRVTGQSLRVGTAIKSKGRTIHLTLER
ncbi:MAG: PASTA domain-containing protein [Alistipes sp.]|nr:PASTA domain-containing protein [Alistipes sp.]